jgi:hypothetical protein
MSSELEHQREVADAIILERAARVLRRRHDLRDVGIPERFRFTVYMLDAEAQKLRGESNSV